MKVYVKTPARLHMGLIDLNGEMGRLFGGLGVAIDHPNIILEVEPAMELTISGQEKELVTSLAKKFFDKYQTKTSVTISIKKSIPAHVGLGSGTQIALAVGISLAKLFKVKTSIQELALNMGRCQRTGVGTAIFEEGGFVVDAGKITKNGVCVPGNFPPLIFRQPFPNDWRFVVAIPKVNKGLANQEEVSAFSQLPPMRAEEVAKICRLTMMKLLPALAEHNIENFGDALTRIQIITGEYFAQAQGGRYSRPVSAECIEFMRQIGVNGVGQSSWGPALYGVVKKEAAKQTCLKVQEYFEKIAGGQVFIAKANNRGATVRVIK